MSWRRRQTATYWPQVPLTIAVLLSHSDGLLNRGSWSWFSLRHLISNWNGNSNCNCNSNWLTQAVCGTWLYNCLTFTCFLWAYASVPNLTTSTGQGNIPTSSTGFACLSVLLLIYTGASLDWRLVRGPICNTVRDSVWNPSSTENTWRRIYQSKRCEYNNKDEYKSANILSNNNYLALS